MADLFRKWLQNVYGELKLKPQEAKRSGTCMAVRENSTAIILATEFLTDKQPKFQACSDSVLVRSQHRARGFPPVRHGATKTEEKEERTENGRVPEKRICSTPLLSQLFYGILRGNRTWGNVYLGPVVFLLRACYNYSSELDARGGKKGSSKHLS